MYIQRIKIISTSTADRIMIIHYITETKETLLSRIMPISFGSRSRNVLYSLLIDLEQKLRILQTNQKNLQ